MRGETTFLKKNGKKFGGFKKKWYLCSVKIMSNSKKKTVMKKYFMFFAAISSMVALGGCSEQVMNDEMAEGESLLRVMTRGETPPQEAKVYVMNSTGNCVRLLSTDEGGQLASTNLAAGTYTVYVVGGDDLSAYTLPSQDNASSSSDIALASGKTMGDLFMKSSDVTLTEGNTSNLELELERKVIMLKEVTIKKVPMDVTKVEVSISPLYEGIKLNGTFSGTSTKALELTKSSDNKTWTNGTSHPYYFPSNGNPTITISFTRTNGVKAYSYQAAEPFEANHQVVIEGTYSEENNAVLSATINTQDWDTESNELFNFTEGNLVPVAGQAYLGYYVVSVNYSDRSAVLLRKKQEDGIDSEGGMNQKFATITKKPEGVTCGDWRLPTSEECAIFIADNIVNGLYFNAWYYCKDGNTLKKMYNRKEGDIITIQGPENTGYDADIYFRPVIDIYY